MPAIRRGSRSVVYLGIDPGSSGGIALISKSGEVVLYPVDKHTPADLWELVGLWTPLAGGARAYAAIERNTGYVGGGGNTGSSMFAFGTNYGMLWGFLIAAKIPYERPTPQQWQKVVGITPRYKGEGKKEWKNRLKAHAQSLFPQETVTLDTADALLIAEYCRRINQGR